MIKENFVSVIIVTFNSETTIKSCLDSLTADQVPKEVLVVDNASSDKTVEVIESFPEVSLIKNRLNVGFGTACNQGAKSASGNFLFFLNPDARLEKNSLENLVSYLKQNPSVAVVGPKLLDEKGDLQKELAPFPTVLDQILILLRFHRLWPFSRIVYPNYDYEEIQEGEHLMGAALLLRQEAFEKVGGFDENYFLWFEETDLLFRLKKLGWKIVYDPQAAVTHRRAVSTRKLNFIKKQTLWNKSLIYYFKKNKEWFKLLLILPFVLLSYIPAAILSLRK